MLVKISCFFKFWGQDVKRFMFQIPKGFSPEKPHVKNTPNFSVQPFEFVKLVHLAGDPRSEEISGFRAYSLGLNIRGRSALQHWPGLWERVAEKVVVFYRRFFLVGEMRGKVAG